MLGGNGLPTVSGTGKECRFRQGVGFSQETTGSLMNSEYGFIAEDLFRSARQGIKQSFLL
jgi:ABC-type lipopolysaccharide export system ATPase subunit